MKKFKGKYRIESARKFGWDYADPGIYFITICTKGRESWFGEIRNGIMGLSDIGCVVHEYWSQIPNHFLHVSLDEFVVMPDHVHGIIVIHENSFTVETCDSHVSTLQRLFSHSLRAMGGIIISRPKPGSISTEFFWHTRFHDKIIQSEQELNTIRQYIRNNPKKWNNH